jgi:hypothetical protein
LGTILDYSDAIFLSYLFESFKIDCPSEEVNRYDGFDPFSFGVSSQNFFNFIQINVISYRVDICKEGSGSVSCYTADRGEESVRGGDHVISPTYAKRRNGYEKSV